MDEGMPPENVETLAVYFGVVDVIFIMHFCHDSECFIPQFPLHHLEISTSH